MMDQAPPPRTPGPRGRRAGAPDTRAQLIETALRVFAERGWAGTSLRGIAREAGVDPALVHHYFKDKVDLYWHAVVPSDGRMGAPTARPAQVVAQVLDGPRDDIGRRWVLAFLSVWDPDDGPDRFRALVHGLTSGEERLAVLRQFVLQEVLEPLVTALGIDHAQVRAQLAGAHIFGLGCARYLLKTPDVAEASAESLAAAVGPVLQHYFFADLPPGILPKASDAS